MLKAKDNKFFIGLIIVIIAVVVLDVMVYAVYKGMSTPDSSLKINSAKAESMSIKIDKNIYGREEKVIVTMVNVSSKPIRENAEEAVTVNGAPSLGKNYGVALIEKYSNGGWLAIEPLWRCNAPCTEPCPEIQAIKSGETKVFTWDQTRELCNGADKDIESVNAGAGRYRISSAVLDIGGAYEMIHSEEFVIE